MKTCEYCGKKLPKGRRRFCSNKHKDRYHNEHNPRGIYAHLADSDINDDINEYGHPFASGDEGHGQN